MQRTISRAAIDRGRVRKDAWSSDHEDQEQPKPEPNDRDHIDDAHHDEELSLEQRAKLRLPRAPFEHLAAKNAHADCRTQATEPDHESGGQIDRQLFHGPSSLLLARQYGEGTPNGLDGAR